MFIQNNLKSGNLEKLSECLHLPDIVYVDDFGENSYAEFCMMFNHALSSGQDIIPIVINSWGGQVDCLFGMIDMIERCNKIVATICQCKAYSAGGILLTCGTEGYRFAAPSSSVMFHLAQGEASGSTEDIRIFAEQMKRMTKNLLQKASTNCGHDKDYFEKFLKENSNSDMYLTAHQAKRMNIVNHVGIPELSISLNTDLMLDGKPYIPAIKNNKRRKSNEAANS